MSETTREPSTSAANEPAAPTPPRPPRRSGGGLVFAVLVLAALAVAAWQLWPLTQDRPGRGDTPEPEAVDPVAERLDALEREIEGLRQTQRQFERRISDGSSAQRVLREEVLGIGERAALLEDSLAHLARPQADAATALRLDEAELLLHIGQQRLQLANDRSGALRAYLLANQVLGGVEDPAHVSLRQTLGQELGALRALGEDPRDLAAGELDALEASLPTLTPVRSIDPQPAPGADTPASGAARLFSQLVSVRRSDDRAFLAPADRELGLAALRLELVMARAAIERRDEPAMAAALARADSLLGVLYADTPALREHRERLASRATTPLQLDVPVLGSTLEQLRQLRRGSALQADPAPAPPPLGDPAQGAAPTKPAPVEDPAA